MGAATSLKAREIILFDGVCNLCNSSVNFVIDRDKRQVFKFASLQSREAEEILESSQLKTSSLDSVVLVSNERIYEKSTAALLIAKRLSFPWKLLYGFIIIPKFLRDPVYNFIARNRYHWFGKRESCRIPTPELKNRFLHSS